MKVCRCFTLLCLVAAAAGAQPIDRLAEFRKAKFGMFIHWGSYSLASVEASWPIMTPSPGGITEAEYRALYRKFNPRNFDPKAWVRLAKAAGQRYIVFTSKHHDGFCMFDSMYTDYKITKAPYGRDIVAELAAACKAEKMPLGLYYSPPDITHPAYRDTSKPASANWHGEPARPEFPLYLAYMELQLRELLTRYGDLFIVWFDGLSPQAQYDGRRFERLIHETQPHCLMNNRIGVPGDYETPEQFVPGWVPSRDIEVELRGLDEGVKRPDLAERVPEPKNFKPWESCITINGTWAYNKNDRRFKSTAELIRTLIDVASKGGNLLLNVGPDPDGVIQPEFEQRLRGIGRWLDANGEAIYDTSYGLVQGLPFGRVTAKGKMLYLHVFDWPRDGRIEVPRVPAEIVSARLLAGGAPLRFRQEGKVVRIDGPSQAPDPVATVIALRMK
jgi:alpha-L-fucosidase